MYFVTDQYIVNSIKSYERSRRGMSGSIRVKIDRREQKRPKQWNKYLKNAANKLDLVRFIFEDWSHPTRFFGLISTKTVFVNVESKFYKLSTVDDEVHAEEEEDLSTDQEEADTKVFLCAKHAGENGEDNVCITTVDSDIGIYTLYFYNVINIRMYIRIGVGNKKRVLDIREIAGAVGLNVCSALPALHAFTGLTSERM